MPVFLSGEHFQTLKDEINEEVSKLKEIDAFLAIQGNG